MSSTVTIALKHSFNMSLSLETSLWSPNGISTMTATLSLGSLSDIAAAMTHEAWSRMGGQRSGRQEGN